MGFAERNSLAGRTSTITLPDAIKRNGSANTFTRLDIQLTDSNGTPNDPDSQLMYVRVTGSTGTALDSLLYTDSGGSTAATNSTNGTYGNGSSAFWKMVTTSGGKITLYHKTGTASSVEGSYNVEVAWFETGSAVATAKAFRIVDAADLDAMSTNIDAVLEDTATTLPASIAAIDSTVGNIPTTAMRGTDSASLASVVGALDDSAIGVASGDNDTAMSMIKGIIADTNELQGDDIPGTLSTLSTAVSAIPTTMVGTNSASLASVLGALNTAADSTVGTTATVIAYIKAILADTGTTLPASLTTILGDTNELQGDWANGGRLDLLLDAVKLVTDALPNSGALTDLATASAISTLQTAVTAIQNNTRFVATVPVKLNRESTAVVIGCYLYDTVGNMEDPDSNGLYVKISQMDGTAIASRYYSNSGLSSAISAEGSGTFSGYYALSRTGAGKYAFFYKNDAAHAEENLVVEFGWEEGSAARYQSRAMQVSDAADFDDVLADTNELQGAWADGGRLDALLDAIPTTMRGTDSAALASVAGALTDAAVSAVSTTDTLVGYIKGILTDTGTTIPAVLTTSATAMTSVLADTGELQTDWVDGGRLDLILDAVRADTAAILVDTGTTLDTLIDSEIADILADTATLGTPAGASHAADIVALKAETVAILADTATLGSPAGASHAADIVALKAETVAIVADTNELQGDWANGGRLDLLLDKAASTVHQATFKKYFKNDTTVISNDPSDDAIAASNTTQNTAYRILDLVSITLGEGGDATFTDVFSVFKWKHQGTNGGGGGAITTKWMVSGAAETAGSAPSGSAVTVTSEVVGTTTVNTSSLSGLLNSTAIAAFATAGNGVLRFLLVGKVADAQDTCTCHVYKSASAEISYNV
jgi:hypothetical protein